MVTKYAPERRQNGNSTFAIQWNGIITDMIVSPSI